MKWTVILVISLMCIGTICKAQINKTDSLYIKSSFWSGVHPYHNEKKLSLSELQKFVSENKEASDHLKGAKTNNGLAYVLAIGGGFFFGLNAANAILSPESYHSWGIAAASGGAILLSGILESSVNNAKRESVKAYNKGLAQYGYIKRPQINLSISENGLGLCLKF